MTESDSTRSDPGLPAARQFSIKWLLWITLVTATVITLTARLEILQFARRIAGFIASVAPQDRTLYLVLAGMMLLVVVGWIIWLGFRLPWLWSSYRLQRNRRNERIAELKREFLRGDDSKTDGQ